MADTAPLITEGKRHHQAGNLQAAEQMYRQVLAADPNHAEAMYFLGILHSQKGLFEQAADFLTKASTIDPRKPVYFYALANAYLELGEHDKAASRYRRALKLHPDFVEAHNNLGAALERSGRLAEAAAAYRRASALRPDFVSALVNLGNVHLKQEELDEAENCYRRAIQLAPDTAEAHNNLGNILQRRGDLDEAVRCFTAALDLSPSYIDAMNNLAGARKARYEVEESERLYVRALELAPGAAPVRLNFGTMLLDQNRTEEAVRQFELALEHDPALTEARWRRRLALPLLYDREEEIDQWRGRFSQGLDALIDETDTRDKAAVGEAARIIGATTNFYLNYQGRDDRELQRKFGAFVHELMAAVHPRWVKPRPMFKPGKDGRIRVGFISAHFRYHAATRMALNFIREGDRDSFKYFCYHTNTSHDDFTDLFRESADGWYENAHDVESMCKRITSDRPHVLIYTDVGMQGAITRLAALRLAPVQCMSWGHPVTSGSPAMDCFLTSDLMEPADGEAHYTEQLIRLPNLGVKYIRPELPADPKSREAFGLPARGEGVVYICCQSLFKYLPQHDHLFIEIAQRVPGAVFAFVAARSPAVTGQFRQRLGRALEEAGLDAEKHCRIFSRLDARTDFLALHMAGDVCLDTPDWSGGNTTIESLTAGLPVVTLPGPFMRGRHACGMMKMLGLEEMIAADKKGYVDLAVRLGSDEAYRRTIAAAVQERVGAIFDDSSPIRALEEHVRQWVEEG